MAALFVLEACGAGGDAPPDEGGPPVLLGDGEAPGMAAMDGGVAVPPGTTAGATGGTTSSTTGFTPVTTGANPTTTGAGPTTTGLDVPDIGGSTTGTTGSTATPDAGTGGGSTGTSTTGMPRDGGMPSGTGGGDEVPSSAYCDPVADWDPAWSAWEEEVLALANERRAEGADCGTEGSFPPVDPLTMNAHLRCAARVHSKDMADRDFMAHTNPDGEAPNDRIGQAGYQGSTWGENIAWGQRSPEQAVSWWMSSDAHCSNIMNGSYTEIGVGFFKGESTSQWSQELMWTQAFGSQGGWGGWP